MPKRKYISEFGLHTYAGYRLLLQEEHLDRVDEVAFEPHIYFICRRPRVGLDAATVRFDKDSVTGRFFLQRGDKRQLVEFRGDNNLGMHDVRLECAYPYSDFRVLDSAGTVLTRGKTSLLVAQLGARYWEYLDLEVLYVGQAYGSTGARTAADRLKRHSTLQGIYAQALQRSPDQEVWLILITVEAQLLASFDGISKDYGTTTAEDNAHQRTVLRSGITERQLINFTEAAFIRYFQPPFNSLFKNTFPNPAHTTYSACYDVDLNAVSTEIDTEDIGCRLWSHAARPRWVHVCTFPLHSRSERMSMFDIPSPPNQGTS
jgi:hypothetical protein